MLSSNIALWVARTLLKGRSKSSDYQLTDKKQKTLGKPAVAGEYF